MVKQIGTLNEGREGKLHTYQKLRVVADSLAHAGHGDDDGDRHYDVEQQRGVKQRDDFDRFFQRHGAKQRHVAGVYMERRAR
jgi:hypothetical protein